MYVNCYTEKTSTRAREVNTSNFGMTTSIELSDDGGKRNGRATMKRFERPDYYANCLSDEPIKK